MNKDKGTFSFPPSMLKRLRQFSKRTGVKQSDLVVDLVGRGLNVLESQYQTVHEILDDTLGPNDSSPAQQNQHRQEPNNKEQGQPHIRLVDGQRRGKGTSTTTKGTDRSDITDIKGEGAG